MSKVYGYCRTARAEEGGIEKQLDEINAYCKQRGSEVDTFFCDEGISAHNMNRSSFNKMIGTLQKGDVVVVRDISRFARDMIKHQEIVNRINNIGAEVMYVHQAEYDELSIKNWLKSRMK